MELPKPIEIINEVISEIEGIESLVPDHGERFRGWYLEKIPEENTVLPLGYKDISYKFPVSDFRYKFYMPKVLSFSGGTIYYKNGERKLGVFRFPIDSSGKYITPIPLDPKKLMEMSEETLKELIKDRKVLLFEAYRIPQFGFKFFSLTEEDFLKIKEITDRDFFIGFKQQYENEMVKRVNEVKEKITSVPNFLLILQNVLDLIQKDMDEVAKITDKIIRNEM